MNGRRIFDWRFVAMFCVMLLVTCAAYTFVRRINQTDALVDTARQAAHASAQQADELAQLREDNAQLRRANAFRSRQASHERDQQLEQIKRVQRQVILLLKLLRANGISVPAEALAPTPGTSSTRPKVPRRTSPATPTPTAPRPSGPPDLTCQLVPQLCGFPLSVPTLLP